MRALEIDESLAEAHAALGCVRLWYEWDWAGAERAFKRAIELNPNYAQGYSWYAEYLVDMGRFDEGLEKLELAKRLDPISLNVQSQVGWALYMARRYDQAIRKFQEVLQMDPNFNTALFWIGRAYEQRGYYDEAIAAFQKARLADDSPIYSALLGHVYAVSGRRGQALKVAHDLNKLSRKGNYVSPYWMAALFTALGERNQAFQWLQKEYDDRNATLPYLKADPLFDSLRTDPRFQDLLRRVGLAP
jgi:tetratricopeptide (TPR) repeat protein